MGSLHFDLPDQKSLAMSALSLTLLLSALTSLAPVRWMFAAASSHPAVSMIASVTPAEMEKSNATIGALFTRLRTEACTEKATTAIRFEGPATIQLSFEVLGRVTGMEMFSNLEVARNMSGLQQPGESKKLKLVLQGKTE